MLPIEIIQKEDQYISGGVPPSAEVARRIDSRSCPGLMRFLTKFNLMPVFPKTTEKFIEVASTGFL